MSNGLQYRLQGQPHDTAQYGVLSAVRSKQLDLTLGAFFANNESDRCATAKIGRRPPSRIGQIHENAAVNHWRQSPRSENKDWKSVYDLQGL